MDDNKLKESSGDYLTILEEAKKQYQQYVELGKLCDLLASRQEEQVEYVSPSFDKVMRLNS